MPFVSPGDMLALQRAAKVGMEQGTLGSSVDRQAVEDKLRVCAVCGNPACSKTIKKANGVYVHPEDVEKADVVPQP